MNPSSVQGPGRSGGTARFLLAFLDGRLKVFVPTNISLVDIDDCVAGHLLAAERGAAGERYLLNGMAFPIKEALALAAEVAGVARHPRLLPPPVAKVAAAIAERGFRLAGRRPPVCREMVRTLLHGHRYDGSRAHRELRLEYTDPRVRAEKTVVWARGEGLLRRRPVASRARYGTPPTSSMTRGRSQRALRVNASRAHSVVEPAGAALNSRSDSRT